MTIIHDTSFGIVYSINRNANANEVNARRILKDLMYNINLKDCFRELVPTGGFTWQRK